jgi:hypothetical protein
MVVWLCALCVVGCWAMRRRADEPPRPIATTAVGGEAARPFFRIVNLVIYNDAIEHERQMKAELTRLFAGARYGSDVKQLFLSCDPAQPSDASELGHALRVRCTESYVPGILHKTVEAMVHCLQRYDFAFLVRSNISTVIDFRRLQLPASDAVWYGSAFVFHPDDAERSFASGTNIILNRRAVEYVVSHIDYARAQVPDDVALADALRPITAPVQLSVPMVWNDDTSDGVVFRNRDEHQDRATDVARMAAIVDRLIATHRSDDAT